LIGLCISIFQISDAKHSCNEDFIKKTNRKEKKTKKNHTRSIKLHVLIKKIFTEMILYFELIHIYIFIFIYLKFITILQFY